MSKFYNPKNILDKNAQYNIVIGERSNGKTYALLKYAIDQYARTGQQMALVRRWQDDFVGKRGNTMFDALVSNNEIRRLTNSEWSGVYYYGSRWFLCRYEEIEKQNGTIETKRIVDETPFCYGFAISSMEHDKSTSYPNITTIIFDEFLTRQTYLPDEFVLFMNVISTIVRHRKNVKIFMLGNTVNKYCPYFAEMGLTHIKQMKPGDIDVYKYGESELKVAVEYCTSTAKKGGKASDFYFAFDNPKLSMITGGSWEIDVYPHCPCKYKPKDILFTYFIKFSGELLQCEIVNHEGTMFTFIHRKTTEIKDPDNDLVFSPDIDPRPNWKTKLLKPSSQIEKRIALFYVTDKVFYQDNEVGEIVRNYLKYCKT